MNIDDEDYSSDSDDADYVPSDGEAVSEEENSGVEEDGEESVIEKKTKLKRGSKKATSSLQPRKRKGGIKLQDEDVQDAENGDEADEHSKVLSEEIKKETESRKEEEEKKKSDDLWASFLSDVGGPKPSRPVAKPTHPSTLTKQSKSDSPATTAVKPTEKKGESVTITKLFDFAGETVKITKQVDANSKEAKQLDKEKDSKPPGVSSAGPSGTKRAGGGLSSVLGMINKKPKISVLGKSKLDWDSFKSEEGISDELQIHNRGKQGYIERQNFLNRTDQRQFEIERDIRLKTSSKR